jgi:superfamily I DNA/RNA helicase
VLTIGVVRVVVQSGDDRPEEERRLFYVGITRAEEQLFLSRARQRFRPGMFQGATKVCVSA